MTIHSLPDLHRRLKAQGFTVEKTASNHFRYIHPDGRMVMGASTPSDSRSINNEVARLENIGFDKTLKKSRRDLVATEQSRLEIIDFLQASPGIFYPASQIMDELGLPNSCIAELGSLVHRMPTILTRVTRVNNKPITLYGWVGADTPMDPNPPQQISPVVAPVRRTGILLSILQYLEDHPNKEFSREQLANALGLRLMDISIGRSGVLERNPQVRCRSKGIRNFYSWRVATKVEPKEEETPAVSVKTETVPTVTPEAETNGSAVPVVQTTLYEYLTDYADGRVVLKDDNGLLWVAEQMVPSSRR